MNKPAVTPLVDLLRCCSREAWAEITEPNGWSFHTNIGKLLHDAADEIERMKRLKDDAMPFISLEDDGSQWVMLEDYKNLLEKL